MSEALNAVTRTLFDAVQGRVGKGPMLRALVPHRGALHALDDAGQPFRTDGHAVLFTSQDAVQESGFPNPTQPCPDWLDLDADGIIWDGGTKSQLVMDAEDLETCRAFRRSLDAERALERPAGAVGARRLLEGPWIVGLDASHDPPRTAIWEADGVRLLLVFSAMDRFEAWAADSPFGPVTYDGAGLCGFMAEADSIDGVCFNPEGPAGPVVVGPAFFAALSKGSDPRTEPLPARSIAEIRLWLKGRRPDIDQDAWVHRLDTVDGALVALYSDGQPGDEGVRTYAFTPVEVAELPETLGPILDPGWVLEAALGEAPAQRAALYTMLRDSLGEDGAVRRTAFHDARQASLRRRFPERFHVRAMV
ncbi:MAG: SseB family protein [Myxococcota bacterium]